MEVPFLISLVFTHFWEVQLLIFHVYYPYLLVLPVRYASQNDVGAEFAS